MNAGQRGIAVKVLTLTCVLLLVLYGFIRSNQPHIEAKPEPTLGVRGGARSIPEASYAQAQRASARVEGLALQGTEPVSTAAPEGFEVIVHVTDLEGSALEDAVVQHARANGTLIGITDTKGNVTLSPRLTAEDLEVAVHRDGYVSVVVLIPNQARGVISVTLHVGCTIDGTIVTPQPSSAVMVMAWRDGYLPSQETIRSVRAGRKEPGICTARSNADGSFSLSSLARGERFTLVATGEGVIADMVSGVSCGDFAELHLSVLYGVIVRVRDPQGLPLKTHPGVFGRGPFWGIEGNTFEAEALVGTQCEILYAGEVMSTVDANGRDDKILFFKSAHSAPRLGPILFELEPPGYRPIWTELWAEPVNENIPEYEVRTIESATGFGSLDVRWANVSEAPVAVPQKVGTVILTHRQTGKSMGIPVTWPLVGERFDGLPTGTYTVRFRPAYASCDCGEIARDMLIEEGRIASLELSYGHCGTAFLELLIDTKVYDGAVQLKLTDMQSGRLSYLPLQHSPYVLPFIAPGVYELEVQIPGRAPMSWAGSMTILQGELTAWRIEVGS